MSPATHLQQHQMMNAVEAAAYTLCGFLITECTVVGTAVFFDVAAGHLAPYKIHKEHQRSEKLKQRAIRERLAKYKTDWIVYLFTWLLSSMTFESELPSLLVNMAQLTAMCVLLDCHIYAAHWWMHTKEGRSVHHKHHSFRYVDCWFVDHESALESALIAVGKHGLLVVFSPHPYVAFVYLWLTKFWNTVAHCGYNLPLFQFVDKFLPFIGSPNAHELHHFQGECNLAIFTTILDQLFGTAASSGQQLKQTPEDGALSVVFNSVQHHE